MKYLLPLLVACAHKPVPVKPVPVTITQPVLMKMENFNCAYLEAFPVPPAELVLNFEDDDIIRRTTVNIREYNEMVAFSHDVALWAVSVAKCISTPVEGL